MLNSIITLKSRLGVTQPMNLCMISTLLKSRLWAIVLLLIVTSRKCYIGMRRLFKGTEGSRNW